MNQINFRVNDIEKEILEKIASLENMSLAELSKHFVLKELSVFRIEIAFKLLQEGKISKKYAFTLSGLTYHEFLIEGANRKVSEKLPKDIINDELKTIRELDIKKFLKSDYESIAKPIQ